MSVVLECRNAEVSVFGDGSVFLLEGLSRMQVFLECRNEGGNSKSQAFRISG